MPGERGFVAIVIVITFAAANGAIAEPAGPNQPNAGCFEIIDPKPHGELRSHLLLDKCSGNTWVLARTTIAKSRREARTVYRWVPLIVEGRDGVAGEEKPAAAPSAGGKCFTFNNLRYCE